MAFCLQMAIAYSYMSLVCALHHRGSLTKRARPRGVEIGMIGDMGGVNDAAREAWMRARKYIECPQTGRASNFSATPSLRRSRENDVANLAMIAALLKDVVCYNGYA
jgi:hypothetical protein